MLWDYEARAEDDAGGDGTDGFVEGVETRGGQDEAADDRDECEEIHG